jgi:hypothetical protein
MFFHEFVRLKGKLWKYVFIPRSRLYSASNPGGAEKIETPSNDILMRWILKLFEVNRVGIGLFYKIQGVGDSPYQQYACGVS